MEVDQVIDQEPEESLEDTIRAAIKSSGEEAAPVAAAPIPEAKPVDNKTRDEAGKFAPAPKEAKRDTLSLPTKAVTDVPETNVITLATAPKAPSGWNNPMREKFSGLPPEVQSYIAQRETDAERKITANDDDRLLGKRVNEMAVPYLPTIRAEGATVEKAFSDYLQTAHVLRSGNDFQKAQAIATVMQSFRVQPQALLSILQGGNVVPGSAPQQAMHNPMLDTLQQRLDRIEADRQAEVQQRQAQDQHSLQAQIDDFASKPGHEHFERVRPVMGMLIENGIASDLEDAYQRASYADPNIRSSLLTATQQSEQSKRLAEQSARTEAAKRAGGSVYGGPGNAKALNGTGTDIPLEETIRAAIRESSGRV